MDEAVLERGGADGDVGGDGGGEKRWKIQTPGYATERGNANALDWPGGSVDAHAQLGGSTVV